ncbi:MAG TPA: hypothetical protein VFQ75_07100 [Candidatus Limnocylindrales bacterium]|nr:hypothetical protein [Candidatus Limnocylindrales bacterium]
MPALTRSIARLPLLVVLAAAISACGMTAVSGPRTWTSEATLPDGTKQTITVRDESGRLTNAEINPAGVAMASEISNPPGSENVVLVPWAGGACDVSTEFVFTAAGQGLAGTMKVTTTGGVCNMMAIQQQLRLTSNAPLPAAQVTLDRAP